MVVLNAVLKVTLALNGVPPNDADGIDPALVFSTLLAKLAVVANDADVAVVALPRNDPLKVPVEPLLLLTSARIQIEEDNGGADTNVNILEDSV